ncbi:MAG: exopolyphosphatase, partial [Bacteroidetes bacterium HGW-Bacteroidetes-22]
LYHPEKYVACATAAMREARNGADVVKKVKKETGISIKIIDGLKEAEIIRSSNPYEFPGKNRLTMYVDVGGGSTEVSVVDRDKLVDLRSFQIGTVRMLNSQVQPSEWTNLDEWLMQFRDYFAHVNVIGSGGNINKIVKLFGRPDDNILIINNLRYGIKFISQLSVSERIEQMALRSDRADVILPAGEIYLHIMEIVKAEEILVPRIGLSDGLIHIMFRKLSGS